MKTKKRELSVKMTLILTLVLSGISMLLTLMIQPGFLLETLFYNIRCPILLVLNYFPMLVWMLLLYFLIGNIFYSASFTTLFWSVLSYINLVKVQARGDPFVPGDVLLVFEGIEAVGSYELQFNYGKLALLLGASIFLWLIGLFVKKQNHPWKKRLAGMGVTAVVFAGAMGGIYMNNLLYQWMPGPDRSNVPAVFDAFGFPYVFLHNFNLYPVDKPADYSLEEAQQYENLYIAEQTSPETAPNIVMIMCEAFTDLPNEEVFTYTEQENPISFYNELSSSEDAISGHIVVSNTGAGTANTEFDILTGMMTNKIGEGTTSAFRVVHRNTDSVPRMLKEAGYSTFFMHPGDNWFYNRESVYSYLGITDQVFKDAFTQEDYKGSWISDTGFLRVLEACLEEREQGNPLFTYSVTIQNHQAYTESKYGFIPEKVQTTVPVSDEAGEYLSVYFEGLRDSDAMLKKLIQFLDARTEPYILVFFGDHQPALGNDYMVYKELGLYPENMEDTEQQLSLYRTPFVIWGNEAYRSENDLTLIANELGISENCVISNHYLGAMTCQIAGYNGWDGYMDYLNSMRTQLPVDSVYGYRLADGTWTSQLPDELQEMENVRWNWQYYRLKQQKVADE